jgi:pimeloyl-ACP methyl ester carboxylesterase
MGFSQGAALAASMLLHHSLEHPSESPLFKAAIFICAPLPFAKNKGVGIDVRAYFGVPVPSRKHSGLTIVDPSLVPEKYFLRRDDGDIDSNSDTSAGSSRTPSPAPIQPLAFPHPNLQRSASAPLEDNSDSEAGSGVESAAEDEGEDEGKDKGLFYNLFHASATHLRISIPTAHIYGRQDEWRAHSISLVGLCAGPVVCFEHDGGHEVPRGASEEIADVVEEVIARVGIGMGDW